MTTYIVSNQVVHRVTASASSLHGLATGCGHIVRGGVYAQVQYVKGKPVSTHGYPCGECFK